jgi:prevent-host-death family protein
VEEIALEKARKLIGEIADRARVGGEHTLITRQGKPAAVVVPADWHAAVTVLIAELETLEAYRDRMAALRSLRRPGLALRDKRVVHHIDGNPYNNSPSNLHIVDPEENQS